MKYRDPRTGETFASALLHINSGACRTTMSCLNCPIYAKDRNCLGFVAEHLEEAVQLMGWEVIDPSEPLKPYVIPEKDNVNHPDHYNVGGVECIEGIKAATVGLEGMEAFCTGNALKYVWRWKHKNGAEDVRKAIWYLERLLEEITNEH